MYSICMYIVSLRYSESRSNRAVGYYTLKGQDAIVSNHDDIVRMGCCMRRNPPPTAVRLEARENTTNEGTHDEP